ncbi:MAG TPA: hypothetical protein VFM54_01525 [Micromonosporaceae bacterium]|nr:hypothetical protein [Micromonosporaceae bacterium]
MVDRVTEHIVDPEPVGEWQERFAELFHRLHTVMIRHPGLVRLRLTIWAPTPHAPSERATGGGVLPPRAAGLRRWRHWS